VALSELLSPNFNAGNDSYIIIYQSTLARTLVWANTVSVGIPIRAE